MRKGIFRFSRAQDIIVREYDPATEDVRVLVGDKPENENQTSHDRANVEETIISRDYLKTLDRNLAPYPFAVIEEWRSLTNFITKTTLSSVLGFDAAGDARCDALMASLADEMEGEAAQSLTSKKMIWGKPRPEQQKQASDTPTIENEKVLRFPVFDLKRSWKPGASGEELSRDSRDKSWVRLRHFANLLRAGSDNKMWTAFAMRCF